MGSAVPCSEAQLHFAERVYRGLAVPCSEARLHSAERVYMEVHPGLARSRTAQRNVLVAEGGVSPAPSSTDRATPTSIELGLGSLVRRYSDCLSLAGSSFP